MEEKHIYRVISHTSKFSKVIANVKRLVVVIGVFVVNERHTFA